MRHHFNKMAWFAWMTVVIVTVLFALLVTFLRIITPQLENYSDQIKNYLNQSIKHPVHIGEIKSDWYGFGPVIEIKDVEIFDNDGKTVLLSAEYARLRFSLFELIRHLSLVPASLSIEGGNITLNYSESKRWSVAGIGGNEEPKQTDESIFEWTPARQKIKLTNFKLQVNAYNGVQYKFEDVHALIDDNGKMTKVQLTASAIAPTESEISIIGDFDSRGLGNGRLEGKLYTAVTQVDWASLAVFMPQLPAQIKQGSGSFELWADWLAGSLYKVQTDLSWQNLSVQFPNALAPLSIDKLKGTFVWLAPEVDQWVFLGDDVIVQTNKMSTLSTDFKWSHNISGNNENSFELDNVNLATLATLLGEIPEFSPYQKQFIDIKPGGYLKNFRLEIEKHDDKPMQFSLNSEFTDLSFSGVPHVKMVSGMSGRIETNDKKGTLVLASQNFKADMPEYFSKKWELDQINATINWLKEKNDWKLIAEQLNIVASPAEKAAVRGVVTIPNDQTQSPFIELLATVPQLQLSDAMEFVPDKKLSPKFAEWLDQAFPKGRLENATLVIRGPARAFPFDNGEGIFEIHAFLQDTTLSYHPAWPKVENIQAELIFSGRRMDATILKGTVTGAEIQKSVVSIPYIGPEHPMVVEVPGVLTGTANSGMKFLQESPLWEKLGADLSSLKFNGPIKVNLNLAFPLGQPDVPPTVLGTIALDQAQVVIPELDLSFNKVVGVLGFSDKAVTAHDLTAELFGRPVVVDVDTVSQPNQPDYLQFRAQGSADPSILKKRYPDPLWNYFNGVFNYSALLERHHAPDSQPSWFLLSSDLKGLKINLPAPLNKAAADTTEFYYRSSVGTPGKMEVRMKYGNKLVTHLEFAQAKDKSTLKRGAAVINSGEIPTLPNDPGLLVTGKLGEISLDDWIPFTMDYIAERAKLASAASLQTPVRARLQVDTIKLARRQLAADTLTAKNNGDDWLFGVHGRDIGGYVTFPAPASGKRIRFDFDHVYWPKTIETTGKTESKPMQLKAQDFPQSEINIDNLFMNQRLIGKIHLMIDKDPKGIEFNEIKVTNPNYTVTGQGQWGTVNNAERTSIRGGLQSNDLGKALSYWGFNTDIKGGKLTADVDLAWPGTPVDFQLGTFAGTVNLKIEDGRIVELNPGGFGRILSLVNLDSLKRRLRLDFSDVLKEGFTFDDVTGTFTIRDGVATTDNTMISSSSTKIVVKGNTNILNRQLDLRIIVMPHLTGPLPIAAAIAVNPIAGAAVWVADKIIGPELQQLTQYWYSVTGTWTAPKVEPIDRGAPTRRKR
jgi:uncharacterized protein (TIGR02099 family)